MWSQISSAEETLRIFKMFQFNLISSDIGHMQASLYRTMSKSVTNLLPRSCQLNLDWDWWLCWAKNLQAWLLLPSDSVDFRYLVPLRQCLSLELYGDKSYPFVTTLDRWDAIGIYFTLRLCQILGSMYCKYSIQDQSVRLLDSYSAATLSQINHVVNEHNRSLNLCFVSAQDIASF